MNSLGRPILMEQMKITELNYVLCELKKKRQLSGNLSGLYAIPTIHYNTLVVICFRHLLDQIAYVQFFHTFILLRIFLPLDQIASLYRILSKKYTNLFVVFYKKTNRRQIEKMCMPTFLQSTIVKSENLYFSVFNIMFN